MNWVEENEKRKQNLSKPYDPYTGLNGVGDRRILSLSDAPFPVMYLPEKMFENRIVADLSKHKSISEFYLSKKLVLTPDEFNRFWLSFCELRLKYDFEFYCCTNLNILLKIQSRIGAFILNVPQRIIVAEIMRQIDNNEPIRINFLKSRQFGGSTVASAVMKWIQDVHRENWNSVVCAHLRDPALRIRNMYEIMIKHQPPLGGKKLTIAGFQGSQSIKIVPERGCTITVGTAESPESVRSDAVKMAHLSEVSQYPNTDGNSPERLEASIISPIPPIPYTLIVRETTACGEDYFYEQYQKAKKGETVYVNVFVEWFKMAEYAMAFDGYYNQNNGRKRKGTVDDFVRTLDDYEKNLFINNPECTLEHLNWYRFKSKEYSSLSIMKQEYPSDDIEAFQFSGSPVFRVEDVERRRSDCCPPEFIGTIASDCIPAKWNSDPDKRKQIFENMCFVEDAQAMDDFLHGNTAMKARAIRDNLLVWAFPDTEINISYRYVVSFDPQKGLSESADFGVITVIDRYWRMYGGGDEVVAQWRGRLDKDIEIWLAAQIAKLYNNALLVVESNTYDSDSGQVDDSEYIFGIISDYYSNLYMREIKDRIKNTIEYRFGFITIRQTKTAIIENYRSTLREDGYVERDNGCLDEARLYETNKSGKFEAKKGHHDDILMSRMIALYVSNDMPMPKEIKEKVKLPEKSHRNAAHRDYDGMAIF